MNKWGIEVLCPGVEPIAIPKTFKTRDEARAHSRYVHKDLLPNLSLLLGGAHIKTRIVKVQPVIDLHEWEYETVYSIDDPNDNGIAPK